MRKVRHRGINEVTRTWRDAFLWAHLSILSKLCGKRYSLSKLLGEKTHFQFYLLTKMKYVQFSCSVVSNSVILWTAACQASLSITNSWSLLKLMSIESVMPSNHLILCHPLLFLPSILLRIRVFSNESDFCIRWPKDWSFSFNISPSNEYPGLIFFRMDWLDLLAVQGTLKSLLQHHSSKASILRTQLSSQSNSYIHTWPLEKP